MTIIRYENFYENGMRKWLQKSQSMSNFTSITSQIENSLQLLVGCDVKSDVEMDKLLIIKGSLEVANFFISTITSVVLAENLLYVENEDQTKYLLSFISHGEATKGFQRLMFILNGVDMVDCESERNYDCKPTSEIYISFE